MFFCTYPVNRNNTGSSNKSTIASPVFLTHITTIILIILHASANMLMIPDVNRFSTVSTSPTNLDTRFPGSCLLSSSADSFISFSMRLLRTACVIFCPNTVRSPSLADSIIPVIASIVKYKTTILSGSVLPVVNVSTISPSTSGGISASTTAPTTAIKMPAERKP